MGVRLTDPDAVLLDPPSGARAVAAQRAGPRAAARHPDVGGVAGDDVRLPALEASAPAGRRRALAGLRRYRALGAVRAGAVRAAHARQARLRGAAERSPAAGHQVPIAPSRRGRAQRENSRLTTTPHRGQSPENVRQPVCSRRRVGQPAGWTPHRPMSWPQSPAMGGAGAQGTATVHAPVQSPEEGGLEDAQYAAGTTLARTAAAILPTWPAAPVLSQFRLGQVQLAAERMSQLRPSARPDPQQQPAARVHLVH